MTLVASALGYVEQGYALLPLVGKEPLRSASRLTLREAAEAWLEGGENGQIRTRSGDEYKPSVLRSYRASLEQRVLPELGSGRPSAITRVDVQDYADRLLAEGARPLDDPQHDHAPAGDLPPRRRTGGGHGQPDHGARAPCRSRASRPNRLTGRGSSPTRSPARG